MDSCSYMYVLQVGGQISEGHVHVYACTCMPMCTALHVNVLFMIAIFIILQVWSLQALGSRV